MIKRTIDLTVSGLLLAGLAPAFLIVALLISIDSRGPVFYRQARIGRGGRTFRIFKFRTMVVDAERRGGPSTADDDPRITRVGKWLRTRKIDELPQLINVLRGDMSLVGPRPEVPMYVALYTGEEQEILGVRPGLTDWATLWNVDEGAVLAGHPDPERAYLELIRPQKIRFQLEYVRHRSLAVDLKILAQTAAVLVFGRQNRAVLPPTGSIRPAMRASSANSNAATGVNGTGGNS